MRWVTILLTCITWNICSSQVVFVTENRFEADWIVFPSQNMYQARNYKGIWYVGNRFEADYKMFFTTNRFEADKIIYLTENRFEAKMEL